MHQNWLINFKKWTTLVNIFNNRENRERELHWNSHLCSVFLQTNLKLFQKSLFINKIKKMLSFNKN